MYIIVTGLSGQLDIVQFSDSGVSPFNRAEFHYFGSIHANEVSKCALNSSPNSVIKFFFYDKTNYLKIITFVEGRNVTFCAVFILSE